MRRKNKIILAIISVILILSTMVITTFADSFQQNDKIYGSISSQLSQPYSNVGKGDMSIIIEADGITYIGDLPQSFSGVTQEFAERVQNPPVSTSTTSTSSTGLVQCTQVGNTLNKVSFNYVSTYQYNYETEELSHLVYFYLKNNDTPIVANINKATIIIENAFTKNVSKEWLSVVYSSYYTSNRLYIDALNMQPPKYKYGGAALYETGRDQYGRIESSIKGDKWVSQVQGAGSQTVRYKFEYGTQINAPTIEETRVSDYGYVKYYELPIYNPSDVNYILYYDKYIIDNNTMAPIQVTDEANPERFFEESILTTEIIAQDINVGDSLVSWISETVEGLYEFYIAPGISLGGILSILVVFGIFIFILKLFMGG